MSFFKKLFGKGKPPHEKAREFLLGYNFSEPICIPLMEESPVPGDVLLQAMEQLVSEKRIQGRFVGKKGWFIPGDPTPQFEQILNKTEKEPVEITELQETLKLSPKRSILALKDELQRKQKTNDYLITDDAVFSMKYLRKLWDSAFTKFDLVEDEITFEDVLKELPHKEVFEPLAHEWLRSDKSPIVQMQSGRLMLRSLIPEMLVDDVKSQWEKGAVQLSFDDLAEKYGVSDEQVTQLILDLVNSGELDDVTVYTTDRMIKRRSSL